MPLQKPQKVEGFYFLVLEGIPPQCQWQELKDYLRDSAKIRPGHTAVIQVNRDGTRIGHCPVTNGQEANKAFNFLVSEGWHGLHIRVSIGWKAEANAEEFERLRGPEASRRQRPLTCNRVRNSTQRHLCHQPSQVSYQPAPAYNCTPMLRIQTPGYYLSYHNNFASDNYDHDCIASSVSMYSLHLQSLNGTYIPLRQRFDSRSFRESLTFINSKSTNDASQYSSKDLKLCGKYPISINRLPADATKTDIGAMLGQFGDVPELSIHQVNEEYSQAIVLYDNIKDALTAIDQLNGKTVKVNVLKAGPKGWDIEQRISENSRCSKPKDQIDQSINDSNHNTSTVGARSPSSTVMSGPLIVYGAVEP